ncbi:hypothetical protein EI534_42570, partial [Pseudomonas frederiksbergensis]|nr:hypothetical protein [Pseudomonas frederiksbergensis]
HTYQRDGREKISFTYPQNLSSFEKLMETKIDFFTKKKISSDDLYNDSYYRNEEKINKLSNEFINRTKLIDKKLISLDIFENRIRFC